MIEPFTLDASVAASWCFPDEMTEVTRELYDSALRTYILVPAIFPVELQNILWTGERRGRLTSAQAQGAWSKLRQLDIRISQAATLAIEPPLLSLSHTHDLTAYDASYLELAMLANVPLATFDRKLRLAAKAAGIKTLPIF